MNADSPRPHVTQAPEALRRESLVKFDAASKAQKPDALGRLDWDAVNREMIAWWDAKGYIFP